MTQRRPILATLLRLALLAVVALAALPGGQGTPVARAATNTIRLSVTNARSAANHPGGAVVKDQPIAAGTHYTWVINEDNIGNPTQPAEPACRRTGQPGVNGDPAYPANCDWPAIREIPGGSKVVAQGDNNTLNAATGVSLPNGKYLISVMADGYKLDGTHFSIPSDTDTIVVAAQPFPLPLATVLIQVVEDRAMTNGEYDIPDENGLAGFEGHINDVFAVVTNDWFGNPLCTTYQKDANGIIFGADGKPVILQVGGRCLSDATGLISIPNLGPNRYTSTVVPPNGTDWVQTSTLEGNHDWDTWVQEGATGFDTERIVNGEPVPALNFTFVCPTRPLPLKARPGQLAPVQFGNGCAHPATPPTAPSGPNNGLSVTGAVKGRVWSNRVYVPPTGGLPYPSSGYAGAKLDKPIADAWLALTDVNQGDQLVYMGKANADGTFNISNVPNGDYTLTVWDNDQEYILDLFNVTVANGQTVDLADVQLAGWWTWITGTVFIDSNGNGKQDPGEQGVPNLGLTLRSRSNNQFGQGSATATTDTRGYYEFREAYPFGSWLVEEMYNQRFQTTGITFQADNQPAETTILGSGVDVNVLNIIGLGGRLDWGIKPYAPGTNGGIVGTVSYDSTRNETEPRYAISESYQPGIGGLNVNLYAPKACTPATDGAACKPNPNGGAGSFLTNADGSFVKGPLLNTYTSEQWQRPENCIARDVVGSPIDYALLPHDKINSQCIESPMQGFQVGTFAGGTDFTTTVDGNYAFGTMKADPVSGAAIAETPLPQGDYIISVDLPQDASGKNLYEVTKEEDVNVFNGDQFVPQVPPAACAGPLHTVHVVDNPADAHFDMSNPGATSGVYNPGFMVAYPAGTPFEGQQKPLCDAKMVHLVNGQSSAQNFNLFTNTPIPGRFIGLIVDDLNLSFNPQDLLFGEKAGVANVPIGIYDFADRLVTTVTSDPDGYYEVQLPSTSTYNCPLPAGPCPNIYRLVGNDPGQPTHPNANYNPAFRTISASFEVWPGQVIPADHAPTQIGVTIQGASSQLGKPAQCALDLATPQIFAVSKPYIRTSDSAASRTITISGQGFGTSGSLTLDTATIATTSWSDRTIVATMPTSAAIGPHQLAIKANNGQKTIAGLTFHVLGGTGPSGYNPTVYEVGPGKAYAAIQPALEAANNNTHALVVVYPGATATYNPLGSYAENIIMRAPIKLQGVGPGGIYPDNTAVLGSVIDGQGFGTDIARETAWFNLLNAFTWTGNQNVYDGQVVYVLDQTGKTFSANYKAAIDGFSIQGGDQFDFPGNITEIFGIKVPGGAAAVTTQGGGIYVNGNANNLQISNNVLRSNGGTYGGAIRLGTPDLPGQPSSQNVLIANNRIVANGGTNRAGAIGIFAGTTGYEIANNDLCGNFSAEYGGAIGHYGLSGGSSIHDNRIYFNRSYDEGGGILIGGEMPTNPSANYGRPGGEQGAGSVSIYNNQIQANLSNDDGGGLRFLQAGNFIYNVYNNMIVNNISTHEGGGVAIDDAPNVRLYNNTIMKNITTATAATSNGQPAPAGLSTGLNSAQLQNTLPPGAPTFSKPLLFNNIFSDNRAGKWDGNTVAGIGLAGDVTPINLWDMGRADNGGQLAPTNSLYDVSPSNSASITADPSNKVGQNPTVVQTYDATVSVLPWRTNPTFVGAAIVAVDLPPNLLGNYHLAAGSPAQNAGAASKAVPAYQQPPTTLAAPTTDIDGQGRPGGTGFDIGADEADGTTIGGGGGGGSLALPSLTLLDAFTRVGTPNNLNTGAPVGVSWSQITIGSAAAIQVNSNQAFCNNTGFISPCVLGGAAIWNGPGNVFGTQQGAALTFANATLNNAALILKASGGSANLPTNFIRARYNNNQVIIETTTNTGGSYQQRGTLAGSFASGDTLTAVANADGSVDVWKTSAATTSYLGHVATLAAFNGSGRIGMQLPNGARVDNFSGRTLP